MTTTIDVINENQEQQPLPGPQKLLLASIGLMAYTTDQLVGLSHKMLQIGRDIEGKRTTRFHEVRNMSRDTWHQSEKQIRDKVSQRVEQVWHLVNVPTVNDFTKMSDQLTVLNEKLDELSIELVKES